MIGQNKLYRHKHKYVEDFPLQNKLKSDFGQHKDDFVSESSGGISE